MSVDHVGELRLTAVMMNRLIIHFADELCFGFVPFFVPFYSGVEYIAVFVSFVGDFVWFFPVCFTWNMLVVFPLYGKWNTLSGLSGVLLG